MRLARLCIHDELKPHPVEAPCPDAVPGSNYSCSVAHWALCDGGEFLTEDTLVYGPLPVQYGNFLDRYVLVLPEDGLRGPKYLDGSPIKAGDLFDLIPASNALTVREGAE